MKKETKTFRFCGRDYSAMMDVLSECCLDGSPVEGISCVKHIPEHSMSVFNIKGVAVILDYSNRSELYFHMGSADERGIKPAIEFLEKRFLNESAKRLAKFYGIELKLEEVKHE